MDALSDDALMILRGKYSTIRAEHEDAKKRMSVLCGALQSCPSKLLKRMQPDCDAVPDSAADLIADARQILSEMELLATEIETLAAQRAELKPLAWPK